MVDHRRIWANGFAILLCLCIGPLAAGKDEPTAAKPLTAEDKELLTGLLKQVLFDPQGAQRVRVKIAMRTAWGTSEETDREGWLVAGRGGQPDRVYFTDGDSIPAPKDRTPVDFLAACRSRWAARDDANAKADEDEFARMRRDSDAVFAQMHRTALGIPGDSDLVLAAWLHRLGHAEMAARALAEARKAQEADPAAPLPRRGQGIRSDRRHPPGTPAPAGERHFWPCRAGQAAGRLRHLGRPQKANLPRRGAGGSRCPAGGPTGRGQPRRGFPGAGADPAW